jgi:putative FmdB family regulatory protein
MPTYDYECTKCGYTFAVEQSIKDKPKKRCPKCKCKLRKLLPQSITLNFKGTGFYTTDNKKGPLDKEIDRQRRQEGLK